jgi:hypothetical protein
VHPPLESRLPAFQALEVDDRSRIIPLHSGPVRSEPRSPRQLHSCPLVESTRTAVSLRRCALGQSRGGTRASLLAQFESVRSSPCSVDGRAGEMETRLAGTKLPADAQSARAPVVRSSSLQSQRLREYALTDSIAHQELCGWRLHQKLTSAIRNSNAPLCGIASESGGGCT